MKMLGQKEEGKKTRILEISTATDWLFIREQNCIHYGRCNNTPLYFQLLSPIAATSGHYPELQNALAFHKYFKSKYKVLGNMSTSCKKRGKHARGIYINIIPGSIKSVTESLRKCLLYVTFPETGQLITASQLNDRFAAPFPDKTYSVTRPAYLMATKVCVLRVTFGVFNKNYFFGHFSRNSRSMLYFKHIILCAKYFLCPKNILSIKIKNWC